MSEKIINRSNELLELIEQFQKTGKPATRINEDLSKFYLEPDVFNSIPNEDWMEMALDAANKTGNIMDLEIPTDFETRLTMLIETSPFKMQLKKFLKTVSEIEKLNSKSYISYQNAKDCLNLLLEYLD